MIFSSGALVTVVTACVLFEVAKSNGTYDVAGRSELAIVVVWGLALTRVVGLWPQLGLRRDAIVAVFLLALLAVVTGLSGLWASSAEGAFAEFDRILLYLAVFVVGLVAVRVGAIERWLGGLAAATAAIALIAFASRLAPTVLRPPGGAIFEGPPLRLSYPLGYWNGLGIYVALGLPLLLRQGVEAASRLARTAALGSIPIVLVVIYLTSSRGAVAVLVVGGVTLLLLSPRRVDVAVAGVCVLAAGAALVAVVRRDPHLVDGPLSSVTSHQKAVIVVASLVLALAGAAAAEACRALMPERLSGARIANLAVVAILAAAVASAVVAAHPVRRFDQFRAPPGAAPTDVQAHLLAATGSGRWQLWTAAVREFESRPLLGRGAGSFQEWWAQHASVDRFFVRDAHSLYLQTAGELGLAGLLPLVLFFALAVVGGLRRARVGRRMESSAFAALLASLGGYLVGAGVDWMWELPAVTVVAMFTAGLLLGSRDGHRGVSRRPRGIRVAAAVTALALVAGAVVAEAIPWVAQKELSASRAAAAAGDLSLAGTYAERASRAEPWAASPKLQLALVREESPDLARARRAIVQATALDPDNWQIWLVRSRIETKLGLGHEAERSLARARELNPRSPLFAGD